MITELIDFTANAMAGGGAYDAVKTLLGAKFDQLKNYLNNNQRNEFDLELRQLLQANTHLYEEIKNLKQSNISISQTHNGDGNNINVNNSGQVDTIIGIQNIYNNDSDLIPTLQKYNTILEESLGEKKATLKASKDENQALKIEIETIVDKLTNKEASYQAYKKEAEQQIRELQSFKGDIDQQLFEQAEQAIYSGDSQKADKVLEKIAKKAVNKAAKAFYLRGEIAYTAVNYTKAYQFYEQASDLEPDNTNYLNQVGILLYKLGDYPKALIFYDKVLVINEKQLGIDHPSTATIYNNLASLYKTTGDYDKALIFHNKALVINEKKLGIDHPDTAATYNNLALLHQTTGDYELNSHSKCNSFSFKEDLVRCSEV